MRRALLLTTLLLLLPALAVAQITDKTQSSAPFGLNAASTTWAGCVFPPSAVASCVKLDYQGYQGVAALLKGTWAATIVGGISADGGTTVTDVNLVSSAGVSAATVTTAGLYNPNTVSGAQVFLIRVSVYVSGSVDVVLRGTSAQARGTPTGGGAPIGGSGTLNSYAKFTPNGSTVGNGLLTDDGTNVSLPSGAFRLYGSAILYSELLTNSSGSLLARQTTVKPAAPTAALAGAGAGNVDNGTHVYCVTFITATGETDCSTSSSAVTVVDKTADGQVTVSFTVSSYSGVIGRNVYRSKAGTTTPIFLVATSPVVANNTATTYTDNIADASLTAATAPTTNTSADARLTITNAGAATLPGLSGVGTRCVNVTSAGLLGVAAADCVTSVAFSAITAGTNAAALVVGTGGSLAASGSGTITATAVPVGGISGLGTGIATALAVNVGSAGAPVVLGGALGTPSSGVGTNLTGTAAGLTAGAATALAADPTDCSAGTVALGINASGTAQCTATPSVTSIQGIIGNVTPAASSFTSVTMTGDVAMAGNKITWTDNTGSIGTSNAAARPANIWFGTLASGPKFTTTGTGSVSGYTLADAEYIGVAAGTTAGAIQFRSANQGYGMDISPGGNMQANGVMRFLNGFTATSGAGSVVKIVNSITPASRSGSVALLDLNPTINGVSTGKVSGLAVYSKTNTFTGGTIWAIDAGTTTTDFVTGATQTFGVKTDGSIFTGGTQGLASANCTVAITAITIKNGLVTAVSGTGC